MMAAMAVPTLVVLAAGRGTRFGGPKQLVAVRGDGATITDIAIERAGAAGITEAIVVVADDVAEAMEAHLAAGGSQARTVRQGGRRGTAQAVVAVAGVTDGPIIVANADDIYPAEVFTVVGEHLAGPNAADDAVVAFPLDRTIIGSAPQSRAIIDREGSRCTGLREGTVEPGSPPRFRPREVGDATDGRGARIGGRDQSASVDGSTPVSMNLFVLGRGVFDAARHALAVTDAAEVYLPDVVGDMIARGDTVRVLDCDGPCRGLTYPTDIDTLAPLL